MTDTTLDRLNDIKAELRGADRDAVAEACELGLRLSMVLDGALPLMEREAAAEARREAGKAMRQITAQQRAKTAAELIERAATVFGAPQ